MNSVIWLLSAFCLIGIQSAPSLPPLPVNPGGIGGLFRGPNSETIIKGPDGSQIVSEQIGGAVQTEAKLQPIVVPDHVAISTVSVAPITSSGAVAIQGELPIVSPSPISLQSDHVVDSGLQSQVLLDAQQQIAAIPVSQEVPLVTSAGEPHIIETELVDAPEIEPDQNSDLKGPSGTISVRGSSSIVSGPASTTISEPVRRIPIASVPVQHIAVQHQPIPVEGIAPATILTPPAPIATSVQTGINSIQAPISLGPVQNVDSRGDIISTSGQTPLISLGGTAGAGIADTAVPYSNLAPPHITIVSSTQSPPISLSTQNGIDLGQTIVSSTQSPIGVASSSDVDVSRISLGQGSAISNGGYESGVSSYGGQNIISSTGAPLLSVSSQNPIGLPQNGYASISTGERPSRPLLTPAVDIQGISGINNGGYAQPIGVSNQNFGLQSNIVNENVDLQNQAILTNQIVSSTPGYTSVDSRDVISPSQSPIDFGAGLLNTQSRFVNIQSAPQQISSSTVLPTNIGRVEDQSRPWLNVEPIPQQVGSFTALPTDSGRIDAQSRHWLNVQPVSQQTGSTASPSIDGRSQEHNLPPIASVLDTVLVQPTDPRNREVIEFNGKQLENVGNIVPVVRNSVLVSGNLNNVQQIPTASVSQLAFRNELDPTIYGRYGRDTKKKN